MTRAVRQIDIAAERREEPSPQPFSAFSDTVNIILLGDPGAGKTHLFRETAAVEQARFITARSFLNAPAPLLRGPSLFIDGLDRPPRQCGLQYYRSKKPTRCSNWKGKRGRENPNALRHLGVVPTNGRATAHDYYRAACGVVIALNITSPSIWS